MKYVLLCSTLALLTACGGQEPVDTTSSSSSSSSSGSNSGSSSSSSSSSSSGNPVDGELAPGALTNPVWELRYVETEFGVRRGSNIPATLKFTEDRQLQGSTVCGAFSSTYWVRHGAMGLFDAQELPHNCENAPNLLTEREYYADLKKVVRFAADESQLKLFTSNNSIVLYEQATAKCANPIAIASDTAADSAAPIRVAVKSDKPSDELIARLLADYPDLEFDSSDECGPGEIIVSVNRVTLEYLRCDSDITAITLQ